jgi:hypothetical protein
MRIDPLSVTNDRPGHLKQNACHPSEGWEPRLKPIGVTDFRHKPRAVRIDPLPIANDHHGHRSQPSLGRQKGASGENHPPIRHLIPATRPSIPGQERGTSRYPRPNQ